MNEHVKKIILIESGPPLQHQATTSPPALAPRRFFQKVHYRVFAKSEREILCTTELGLLIESLKTNLCFKRLPTFPAYM